MFDDAEKKIARLMADSTTPSESRTGLGKIKVKGRNNFVALGDVNVTINLHQLRLEERAGCAPVVPSASAPPTSDPLEHARRMIRMKCEDLGDAMLYRPFIQSVFKAGDIADLSASELRRLSDWLGIDRVPSALCRENRQ